jgi:hypothetical protein
MRRRRTNTASPPTRPARATGAPRTLRAAGPGSPRAAYFNRGFVISQFVSRILDELFPGVDRETALRRFKAQITEDTEDRTRLFLAAVELLDDVANGSDHLYAELDELGDDELVGMLERLGPRAHVVLSPTGRSSSTRRTAMSPRPPPRRAGATRTRPPGVGCSTNTSTSTSTTASWRPGHWRTTSSSLSQPARARRGASGRAA